MTGRSRASRFRGAGLFLLCANLGLLSFGFMALEYALELGSPVFDQLAAVAALLFLVSLIGLFVTRSSDEYVAALWNSAASAAFVALVLGMILTQVGLVYLGHENATREQSDRLHSIPLTLPFLAFFLVLSFERLRRTR